MPQRLIEKKKPPGSASSATKKGGAITPSRPTRSELWRHVGSLAASSAMLLFLAELGSDRLSLTQATFFLLAATADAAGKPVTRTELIDTYLGATRGSIRNTYRQLLEPSRVHPNGLGWLTTEENPMDARERVLRLTDEGKRVIEGTILALEPIISGQESPASATSH